jgi:hypothetical protein
MFRKEGRNNGRDNNGNGSGGGGDASGNRSGGNSTPCPKPEAETGNKGTLMLDATCAPADIAYPTDINLLNEAREKLEDMIDTLHVQSDSKRKPRTYRKKARKQYLQFILQRKPGIEKVRKAISQQLQYVSRDIRHIDRLVPSSGLEALSANQQKWLETIRTLYEQQSYMYRRNTHSVENRIVSISQPHVRPIVRGKARAPVEFGAKVSISLVNGYAFVDVLDWESYNEEKQLIPAIESYKQCYGHYPERVLADQIYRNKDNRAYCKERGVRLSGPRLGRPPKETDKSLLRQERQDSSDRSVIEGKFGEGKNRYGLDRIMARLKDSSETVITMSFFCMNLFRRLRFHFRFFWPWAICAENVFFFSIVRFSWGF